MRRTLRSALVLALAVAVGQTCAGTSAAAVPSPGVPSFDYQVRQVGATVPGLPKAAQATSATAGDFNGDGRRDVVVATTWGGATADQFKLFVYSQNGRGQLGAPVRLPIGCNLPYPEPKGGVAQDFNGDGRTDFALVTPCGIVVFLQRAGQLRLDRVLAVPGAANLVQSADVDGDGRPDLVVHSYPSGDRAGAVVLLRNTGASWTRRTLGTGPVRLDIVQGLAVDDVTGDGRPDIVLAENGVDDAPLVDVLRNTGAAFVLARYHLSGSRFAPLAGGVTTGDINGDGRRDVVATVDANRPDSRVQVLRQTSAGTLALQAPIPVVDDPEGVAVRDMNGDGRSDVVLLHGGWETTGLLLQRTDRTLDPTEHTWPAPYESFLPQRTLVVDDLSGDGRPDVAIASANYGLALLRQTG